MLQRSLLMWLWRMNGQGCRSRGDLMVWPKHSSLPEQKTSIILAQRGVRIAVNKQLCVPQPSLFLLGVFRTIFLSLCHYCIQDGGATACLTVCMTLQHLDKAHLSPLPGQHLTIHPHFIQPLLKCPLPLVTKSLYLKSYLISSYYLILPLPSLQLQPLFIAFLAVSLPNYNVNLGHDFVLHPAEVLALRRNGQYTVRSQ